MTTGRRIASRRGFCGRVVIWLEKLFVEICDRLVTGINDLRMFEPVEAIYHLYSGNENGDYNGKRIKKSMEY